MAASYEDLCHREVLPADFSDISRLEISLENQPTVTLDLYRYDGTSCLAVVDGEPFALVSRESVVDLIEAVNEFALN